MGQVGRALACMHRSRLVHLDVKPQNVLVAEDGTLKLGDLGTAVQEGETVSGGFSVAAPGPRHSCHPLPRRARCRWEIWATPGTLRPSC